MRHHSRREFLRDVGRGMLAAGLGAELAAELQLSPLYAGESTPRLDFGELEPLVALMQETSAEKLLPQLVSQLQSGTSLKTLVAAGALANARTFGGQDYIGFHTFMALAPAYRMAQELPVERQPLPVLKVLHRNATRMQALGGRSHEMLSALDHDGNPLVPVTGETLREASRAGDVARADRTFGALAEAPIGEAFNHLQFAVEDEVDVHRVVLAWRGWDTRELAGEEWGHTLLRQSIRYCAQTESQMIQRDRPRSNIRTLLPKLLDQYQLVGRSLGDRAGDDVWLSELADTIFRGSREQAADAAAQALRDGWSPESVGEALSVAANWLVLHDPGRPEEWTSPGKPVGSCHGDSVGVHASDAANAWRNIVRVSDPRNIVASLIVGAFHTAGQHGRMQKLPYPLSEHLSEIRGATAEELLEEAGAAIEAQDQFRAAAAAVKYGSLGFEADRMFGLLLGFATRADGALHAEKYYSTARQEYATTRVGFRWGQVVALARVTASQSGFASDGFEQARALLKLT